MPRRLRAALFGTQAVLNRGNSYSTTKATGGKKLHKGAKAEAFLEGGHFPFKKS